jgi:hypothetical protein
LSYGLLAVTLGWIVLSYQPAGGIPVQLAFRGEFVDKLFGALLIGSGAAFLAIQFLLLGAVFKLPERVQRLNVNAADSFQHFASSSWQGDLSQAYIYVDRKLEFLWTAVPMVMTTALFGVSYWMMQGLPTP